jgi:ADP-heptose:LPS heptosyltransferase
MSHIAEVYAKDLGAKIGKPIISNHFFPGVPDKYITIQASNKTPASNYNYWDLVISLIKPFLGDIKIVQVGGPGDKLIKGIDLSTIGNSYKQMNYVIKGSKAHVGCDSLPGHVASVYDVPSIILHYNLYKENSKPIWHENNTCTSISPDFSKTKPSYSSSCNRINEIKPEKISQAVLDQLNIQEKIKFKTVRIGSSFNNETVEIIPNFSELSVELKDKPINIRGDIHWDLENIIRWCQYSFVNLYINSSFDTSLLKYMPNLKQVIYECKENVNVDETNFFKALKNNKINVVIRVNGNLDISNIRLKYFDFNVLEHPEPPKKIHAAKFLSKKRFVSNAEVFNSEFSAKRLDKSNDFIYNECSSKELESLYLYDEEK